MTFKTILTATAIASLPVAAIAVPLNGSFAIDGSGQNRIEPTGSIIGIDFSGANAEVSDDDQIFGDFQSLLAAGDDVDFDDELIFDSAGGFSYTVDGSGGDVTFTVSDVISTQVNNADTPLESVDFLASGTFSAPGFDDTMGTFSYTGQQAGQSFSFSTSQIATPIPVPAAGVLLIGGLGGLAALRRRK